VVGSAFALVASIKFHSPNFLADSAWLTYGRVRPASVNCMLYGFCVQAGVGVALWLLARLGRSRLALPGLVIFGTLLWNFGVKLGIWGILSGDSTGFECLEMPGYAAWIIFLAYLLIGLAAALTFHQRRERQVFVSQWFIFAALFWFPWVYSTAELLLVTFPVRGAAQVAVWGYYVANLAVIWLGLIGLAAIFYFVAKLTRRELHSRHLALFAFWLLILVGGWTGIPVSAPLPAWMPALSTVATMLLAVPIIAVTLAIHRTVDGNWFRLTGSLPLRFIAVGTITFFLAGVLRLVSSGMDVTCAVGFTWLTPALTQLNAYGFFCFVMFGAIYAILPQLTRTEFPSGKLLRIHFWLAALGLVLLVGPLAAGGLAEAHRASNPTVAFTEILQSTLPFLRASTMGDLLLALGHLVFLVNLGGLAIRFYRPRAVSAYRAATADLAVLEAKS
jgi:cytochrome c oxidase cbb3-type subunit I